MWDQRPGTLLHSEAILVPDSYRGHLTPGVKQKLQCDRTHLVVIPGGMTFILQLLDVCMNKPFKDRFRQLYWKWTESGSTTTPAGRLKRPSASTVAHWVSAAWYGLSHDLVYCAFKKCSISNALQGSEDDLLWEAASDKEESSCDDDSDGDNCREDEDA
ncbi:hypothetical protein V5799_003020 [Amblyomma americanum]|uniref:DDE-1 domain-containing protein n=1 Tax=Amblyomma americanum TaxID=6943 RepID=A0AAQ4DA57_AMBAM